MLKKLFVFDTATDESCAGARSSMDCDYPFMSGPLLFAMDCVRSPFKAKMCMVPLSEEQDTYFEVGSKLRQYTSAGSAPRLSSWT